MKISPVAGAVPQSVNPNEGQSAGADRMARAKAIAQGQDPALDRGPAPDPQVERAENSIKRIKLRTQRSPDRHNRVEETPPQTVITPPEGAQAPVSDVLATTEQATAVSEDTKPLSPQFAALARQKREIQLERQKLDAEKQALASQSGDTKSLEEYRSRIKANALSVLMEEGVTYDQLTEQILASNQENADLTALKSEMKALKDGFDNQTKSMTEREAQQEKQALAQIERETTQLISEGDDFEMIREAGYAPKVVDLIHRVFKKTGEVMDTQEAANLIEAELLEESLKFARIRKVQSKLGAQAPAQKPQPVQQDRPGTKIMRTLTNRDGVSSTSMSKRERAIAAMEGRLK